MAESGPSGVEVLNHERNRDNLEHSIEVTKKVPLGQCKEPRYCDVYRRSSGGFEFPRSPRNIGRGEDVIYLGDNR